MDLEDDDFELDDELIAASSFIEEHEQDRSIETQNLPYLHCTGDDSSHSTFHRHGYVRNFTPASSIVDQCVESPLFGLNLTEDALLNPQIIRMLFNKARMHIQMLDVSSREDATFFGSESYFQLRLQVTKLLTAMHALAQQNLLDSQVAREGLGAIHVLLGSIEAIPIGKVLHNATSHAGNECSSPVYHLLHGNLEWRWLRLRTLLELVKQTANAVSFKNSDVEEQLQMFLSDLVMLSVAKYNRLKHVELLYGGPFQCTCIKEMWLLLQLEVESLHECDSRANSFWSYFNGVIECVRDGKNAYELYDKTKINRKVTSKLMPSNWDEFTMWLLCGVAKLHGFSGQGYSIGPTNLRVKDNYEFMEKVARDIVCSDPSEENLRIVLYVTFPILAEWWVPRTEMLMNFWEYFHKKLNSSFFLQGSAPSSLAVISGSVVGYLRQIKGKIEATSVNPNETSYSIFIHLFGHVLRKLADSDESQIKKILGRITSKFSTLKMLALNETGIHNVVSLFLALALTSNLSDTGQRIQNVLLQMPLHKLTTARQLALLRGHVSLLILFAEKQLNIATYVNKVLEQLAAIHLDEGYTQCLKILADGMLEILGKTESFELGEHVLLGVWLEKHLTGSTVSEQMRILECMNECLSKIGSILFTVNTQREHNLHEMLAAIYKYILPYIQRVFGSTGSTDDYSGFEAELAAKLCLNAHHCPSVLQTFDELFKGFAEANSTSIQTLTSFLVRILSTDKVHTVEQSFIIRSWIKCCICSNTTSTDLYSLTAIVVGLEEFRVVCDAEASEIVGAKDPLCMFFLQIGISYQLATDFRRKYLISEKVYAYLLSFDSYIAISLENLDNTMKIYSMIAIIILHCSQIVYIKGKNSCFFNVAMFQYILPNHLLTGRPQKPQHVQAVNKIWHLLLMGIEKLDFKNDKHLITILTNLIEKWLPHFKSSQSKQASSKPFLSCLKECNSVMANFVFDKISMTFLQLQRRQPHQHAMLVLSMLGELVASVSGADDKLETLLKSCGYTMMEHAMMVDDTAVSKPMIFDFFGSLVRCDGYHRSAALRQVMCGYLTTLTSKHLAYYSALFFQFMQRFVKIDPIDVKRVIPHVQEIITNVEHMRGAGRDGKLRNELHKLEGSILAVL